MARNNTLNPETLSSMVSVASHGQDRVRSVLRLLSKCTGIAVFVTGTALFASVHLLALPVAVITLTLILAVRVFGRAITGWIVSGVGMTEPLMYVIVNTTREAQRLIARILSFDEHGGREFGEKEVRKVQVELRGHVFVGQRCVARRSPGWLKTLGILAEPFDLRKLDSNKPILHVFQPTTPYGLQ